MTLYALSDPGSIRVFLDVTFATGKIRGTHKNYLPNRKQVTPSLPPCILMVGERGDKEGGL